MTVRKTWFLHLAIVMSSLGCNPASDVAPKVTVAKPASAMKSQFADEGRVCVTIDTKVAPPAATNAEGASFLIAGAPLIVSVHAPREMPVTACLQGSSSCQVQLEGATLQVHSRLQFDLEGKLDCIGTSTAAIVCDGPPLTAGQYALQHGSSRSSLSVPLTTPLPFCTSP